MYIIFQFPGQSVLFNAVALQCHTSCRLYRVTYNYLPVLCLPVQMASSCDARTAQHKCPPQPSSGILQPGELSENRRGTSENPPTCTPAQRCTAYAGTPTLSNGTIWWSSDHSEEAYSGRSRVFWCDNTAKHGSETHPTGKMNVTFKIIIFQSPNVCVYVFICNYSGVYNSEGKFLNVNTCSMHVCVVCLCKHSPAVPEIKIHNFSFNHKYVIQYRSNLYNSNWIRLWKYISVGCIWTVKLLW